MKSVLQADIYYSPATSVATHPTLPVGVYTIEDASPMRPTSLRRIDDLTLPEKIYGKDEREFSDRVLRTYRAQTSNVGVFLNGVKGSGKTLCARRTIIESGLPVIVVHKPLTEQHIELLSDRILGDFIVFIDEFEKIYAGVFRDSEDNTDHDSALPALLSFLDGSASSHILFLFTSNSQDISEFLVNRLGRIKFFRDFHEIDQDVIEDYLSDNLVNQDHAPSVLRFFDVFSFATFDILTHLVSEMNIHGDDAITCSKFLNLREEESTYHFKEIINGEVYTTGYTSFSSDLLMDLDSTSESIEIERLRLGSVFTSDVIRQICDSYGVAFHSGNRDEPDPRTGVTRNQVFSCRNTSPAGNDTWVGIEQSEFIEKFGDSPYTVFEAEDIYLTIPHNWDVTVTNGIIILARKSNPEWKFKFTKARKYSGFTQRFGKSF